MDISTKTGADLARSQLLSVLSNIQNIYQTSNTPPATPTTPSATPRGTASATTTAQLASYSLALSLLGTSSSDAMNNIADHRGRRHGRQQQFGTEQQRHASWR